MTREEFDTLEGVFEPKDNPRVVSESKPKAKSGFSKFMVVLTFLTLLGFTGVVLWFNYQGIHVSETLINRFILALFGELGILGAIRGVEEWGRTRSGGHHY